MAVRKNTPTVKKPINFKFGKKEKILSISIVAVLLLILYPIIEINGGFASSGKKDIVIASGENFDDITEK